MRVGRRERGKRGGKKSRNRREISEGKEEEKEREKHGFCWVFWGVVLGFFILKVMGKKEENRVGREGRRDKMKGRREKKGKKRW